VSELVTHLLQKEDVSETTIEIDEEEIEIAVTEGIVAIEVTVEIVGEDMVTDESLASQRKKSVQDSTLLHALCHFRN
jgi:hypothetical protein